LSSFVLIALFESLALNLNWFIIPTRFSAAIPKSIPAALAKVIDAWETKPNPSAVLAKSAFKPAIFSNELATSIVLLLY
jgi:hypothetical protein